MSRVRFEAGLTRSEALRSAVQALDAEGIAEARIDARFLVLHALSLAPTDFALRPNDTIGETGRDAIREVIRRRCAGEPVARILGQWEFWSLPFALSSGALIPRPDTETLVESALGGMPDRSRPWRLLDLGTGSGCILVALLVERPKARGIGIDLSFDALETARCNAARHGVVARAVFARADWCDAVDGPFDLIVANPPYIPSEAISELAVEVRKHDPRMALDGGRDGLDAYRAILGRIASRPSLLAPDGAVMLEIGCDQAEAVARIGGDAGLISDGVSRDLTGRDRVVTLRPPSPDRSSPRHGDR